MGQPLDTRVHTLALPVLCPQVSVGLGGSGDGGVQEAIRSVELHVKAVLHQVPHDVLVKYLSWEEALQEVLVNP